MTAAEGERPRFELFRAAEAQDYATSDCMAIEGVNEVIAEGLGAMSRGTPGQKVEMVYKRPGMSLTRVWFKSGYPLPLHTHSSDCVYYIVAGSVAMGDEVLGPGDGFFVGSEVPYTYTIGPEGVEVLEFRTTDAFNIRFMARTATAWQKAARQVEDAQDRWRTESPPARTVPAGA